MRAPGTTGSSPVAVPPLTPALLCHNAAWRSKASFVSIPRVASILEATIVPIAVRRPVLGMVDSVMPKPVRGASAAPFTVQNTVLATLSEAEFALMRPHLKTVPLKRNEILQDALRYPDAAYFIESGVVSRLVRTAKDGPVEVAVVGKFGFVGVSLVLGTMQTVQRSVVRVPGSALRIEAGAFRNILQQSPAIREHLLRYVQLLIALNAQIALCNARHEISERAARWILLAQDRIGDDRVPVTHGMIASALGVRRPGVSKALSDFQAQGIIEGSRGAIRIRDIAGLRQQACECERIVKDRFRIFRDMPHHHHRVM
ncbi:Crp/Fnr family transcriptional regulator [Bradyrhizobium sp. WBOS4]|nr:Crp/Fnr family transcriptional regulator [Bradyrhizobium sp. WBOS8]MDD1585622.1 Crp/Fnr family transcriptional regulator [Bradyrhizobium sp. WBOS4]UUO49017.1 Crp/Fnr family transcriptional regulator [Bradyrhizobium sp. WBOS04]UUO62832.1 Crp/Fnr family transcriptional regulator [Bradyrhizobium sp. WBOS08]